MSEALALLCTRGFADVLALGRQNRADPYAVHVPASPWLRLLPAEWRIEVAGRIDATGREVEPLDAEGVRGAVARLKALPRPPQAIAISLLFSHRNAAHELALAKAVAAEFPQARIACSHQVLPQDGEYERTLATVQSLGLQSLGLQSLDLQTPVASHAQPGAVAGLPAQLENIADRMQDRLMEAAVSSVVREAMDCAAALFLPDGRMVAQARTLPLLLGSLSPAVKGILQSFPAEGMREGDGFLSNDPWRGGTHLPDFVLLRPVLCEGEVRALAACVMHHQDVGGIAPGSVPTNATSIQQEGLRIPPVKLYGGGVADASLMGLLCANSRMPDNLAGDLDAQWQCLASGVHAMQAVAAAPDFSARCEAALSASEAATRAALAAAPDGDYAFTDALDGDGISLAPVPVVVRLQKRGDAVTVDLSACAPQTAGPVNASRGAVWAAVSYFARMLAPHAASNDGCTAPITLRTAPRTIVDPDFPAALNARTNLVKLLANALTGAWAQALPGQVPAPNAGEVVVLSLGGDTDAESGGRWLFTEIIASAAGGAPWGPGGSGVSTDVGNARNTPAEVIESQAPLRVERAAIRQGSGGAGMHRGGDGVVRAYRLLAGTGSISYRGERHGIAPQGAAGGAPGAFASARIERADGRVEHLAAKARAQWSAGDLLVIETAGGGGWGAPADAA